MKWNLYTYTAELDIREVVPHPVIDDPEIDQGYNFGLLIGVDYAMSTPRGLDQWSW